MARLTYCDYCLTDHEDNEWIEKGITCVYRELKEGKPGKTKITNGMKVPEHLATKFRDLMMQAEGIEGMTRIVLDVMGSNRTMMRRVWKEVGEEFDLGNIRWRVSHSPKTDFELYFEAPDHYGLDTREDD